MTVAERIRQLREWRGLSQREVSRASGISSSFLSRIESGEQAPSLHTIERLGELFCVNLRDVLCDDLSPFVAADPFLMELVPLVPRLSEQQRVQVLSVLRDL